MGSPGEWEEGNLFGFALFFPSVSFMQISHCFIKMLDKQRKPLVRNLFLDVMHAFLF